MPRYPRIAIRPSFAETLPIYNKVTRCLEKVFRNSDLSPVLKFYSIKYCFSIRRKHYRPTNYSDNKKVVELSLVLLGSNSAVKCLFSLEQHMDKFKNGRIVDTSCEEFYDQILVNKSLLKQVHRSAKYLVKSIG